MGKPPYVPFPHHLSPGRRRPALARKAFVAGAVLIALAAAGLGGDGLGGRGAPAPAPRPPLSAASAAGPGADAVSAPAAQASDAIAVNLDVDAVGRTAEENQLVAMMNAEAAEKIRADEALLPLVTWSFDLDDPPKPTPTSATAVVDGVSLRFPVEAFPDNKDYAQHWGFVVRAAHRAARHRVSFADNDKVYEWTGVRWIQTKGDGAAARR